jgi:hypothetical protein
VPNYGLKSSALTRRDSVIVASNPLFEECTSVFGSDLSTGALLYRVIHHVQLNRDSSRFKQGKRHISDRSRSSNPARLLPPNRLIRLGEAGTPLADDGPVQELRTQRCTFNLVR